MPVVGTMRLGQWGEKFSTQLYLDFIKACLDLGITDFDHADIYGHYTTESEFGSALKLVPSLRTKMRLITKCGIKMVSPNRPDHRIKSYDSSAEHIKMSVDNSLKNLNTDYIDLLLIHRPDLLMDAQEIADCFSALKLSGKVRYFGVSNFTPSQFELLDSLFPMVTNQVEASPLHLNPFHDGCFDQCQMLGIQAMIWSPFAGRELFQESSNENVVRIKTTAEGLCTKYDCSLDQLVLAWLSQHPSRPVPVLGTSKIERIEKAIKAQSILLTREDWYILYTAATGIELA
ncbi:MAG: aldo/keto reductase [Saprospiraceae bacterium]|nr:aldo/keto reductase [Saprospiraceae bacterium]